MNEQINMKKKKRAKTLSTHPNQPRTGRVNVNKF